MCTDSERKAGRPERGAADGAGHGGEHTSAVAHQHAALRPASLLPRPQGEHPQGVHLLQFIIIIITCYMTRHVSDWLVQPGDLWGPVFARYQRLVEFDQDTQCVSLHR